MDVRKILLIIFLIAACNQTDSSDEDVTLSTFKDSACFNILSINSGPCNPSLSPGQFSTN